jgi:hypothetical protein
MAYNTFKIVGGKATGQSLFFDEHKKVVVLSASKKSIALSDISSLELIESKVVKAGDSVTFGIVGAILGGPLGAAAGASLGGLSRPCTFMVGMSDGDEYVCEGWRLHYNKLLKAWKIVEINKRSA